MYPYSFSETTLLDELHLTGIFRTLYRGVLDSMHMENFARGRQASTLQFSCQVSSTRERDHEYFHTPRHKMFWRALTSLWAKRGSKSINSFQSSQLSASSFEYLCVHTRTLALEYERMHSKCSSTRRAHASAGNWLTSKRYTTHVSLILVCQVSCDLYCNY